jgi:uncharacterized protein (TIGR02246 family)
MRTILTCAAILACAACNQPSAAPSAKADAAAETAAIKKVEQAQLAGITARDQSASTAPYSADAVFIDDHGNASRGTEAIGAVFKGFLADPTMKLDYKPGAKVLSDGGDMAYSTAEYTETYTDPATKKLVNIKGTNLSVWKKQADGSWKLVADSNPAGPTG